ncbi:hypothetical protein [Clavibacter sp. VKM Ac-2542]|uniref:hypothetical protein n=1 Tax=Clavibacter sp. VKM Ac-2542 TaxID=2783811 RepID=UPI00188CFD02|nr:hypothetical protein [Clavibacter sp. VKM Ac-2542]MBF4622617.1 hypothetical protein [Clavibacter sp. VKM Ac-2542]
MIRKRATLVGLLAMALAGCSAPIEPGPASVPAQDSSALTPSADPVPGAAMPSPDPDPSVAPQDSAADVATDALIHSIVLARDVMGKFCRPSLDEKTWINDLYPSLTSAGGEAYATVDPANVPCTAVTGEPRLIDGDAAFTMVIGVPTDAGEYRLYAHRAETTDPFLVEQITPQDGE